MEDIAMIQNQEENQSEKRQITYIKESDINGARTDKKPYHQCFTRDNFSTVTKTPIMAMKQAGTIDDDDIKIIEFVYVSKFSTLDQIERFCEINKIEEGRSRVEMLIGSGLINSFFLVGRAKTTIKKPADAKMFYCLKQGGKYLLEQFSDRLFIDWQAGDNITAIKNIENMVALTEICLDMMTANVKMKSLEPYPEFDIKGDIVKGSAYYGFSLPDGGVEYMIFDAIRREDNIDNIRKKIRMWESLLRTQIWKRYFNDTEKIPMLVFITDNDDTAFTLAQNIATGSRLNVFLITTFERIAKKSLGDTGRFIKYNREDGQLYEISYKLFA